MGIVGNPVGLRDPAFSSSEKRSTAEPKICSSGMGSSRPIGLAAVSRFGVGSFRCVAFGTGAGWPSGEVGGADDGAAGVSDVKWNPFRGGFSPGGERYRRRPSRFPLSTRRGRDGGVYFVFYRLSGPLALQNPPLQANFFHLERRPLQRHLWVNIGNDHLAKVFEWFDSQVNMK
jgi:hypothetical protein